MTWQPPDWQNDPSVDPARPYYGRRRRFDWAAFWRGFRAGRRAGRDLRHPFR